MTRSRETQHEARDRRRAGWRLQAETPRRGRVLKRQRCGGGAHLEQKKTKTAFFGRKKKEKNHFIALLLPAAFRLSGITSRPSAAAGLKWWGRCGGGREVSGQRSGLRLKGGVKGQGSEVTCAAARRPAGPAGRNAAPGKASPCAAPTPPAALPGAASAAPRPAAASGLRRKWRASREGWGRKPRGEGDHVGGSK